MTAKDMIAAKQPFREAAEQARDAHIKSGRVIKSYLFNHIYADVSKRAKKYKDSGFALDLGTALGVCGAYLDKTGHYNVTSLQHSEKAIENGKRLWQSPKMRWHHWDSRKIPVRDGTFDLVVSNLDVLHWRDPVSVFNEIHRVLRPYGAFMISDIRSDAPIFLQWFAKLYASRYSKALADESVAAFKAAYSFKEIQEIISETDLNYARFDANVHSYFIKGKKGVEF